jgi:hypothetical protein
MKHQIRTSKLQRSSKDQAPTTPSAVTYPEAQPEAWVLHDDAGNGNDRHSFDLEERTAKFGEAIIRFCKKIPHVPENHRLIDQLVGCGTSVGANDCEANEDVSKKRFRVLHRTLRERSKRNQVLPAHGGRFGTNSRRRSTHALSGGEGIASDFREHVPQMNRPSTNIQASEKLQTPSFNQESYPRAIWCLEVGASLVLGAWTLGAFSER